MTAAEWKEHYDRIMAARDAQELIYLDQLKTAWAERDEALAEVERANEGFTFMVKSRDEARGIARDLLQMVLLFAPQPGGHRPLARRLLDRARQLAWLTEPNDD